MTPTNANTDQGQDPHVRWAPTGTLAIDTVASHWTTLQAQLGSRRGIEADLSAVERVDTAGVQLLLQLRRTCDSVGQALQVRGLAMPSDTSRLLGITNEAAAAAQVTPADAAGQEG